MKKGGFKETAGGLKRVQKNKEEGSEKGKEKAETILVC